MVSCSSDEGVHVCVMPPPCNFVPVQSTICLAEAYSDQLLIAANQIASFLSRFLPRRPLSTMVSKTLSRSDGVMVGSTVHHNSPVLNHPSSESANTSITNRNPT